MEPPLSVRILVSLFLLTVAFIGVGWAQSAASGPVGLWATIDDRSGRERGLVRIFETDGKLYGRIENVFEPGVADKTCEKCAGDRHNKPIIGLDVIRGLRPDGDGRWSGGEILDPETGDTYRVSMRLADSGRKLVVRGSLLGGLIGRSQTWLRTASNQQAPTASSR